MRLNKPGADIFQNIKIVNVEGYFYISFSNQMKDIRPSDSFYYDEIDTKIVINWGYYKF